MGKLIGYIIFHSAIILLFIIMIFPVDKRDKYQGLKHDCFNHGLWLYDRIHNNDKQVDVVFLGSSHTINAVNDELVTQIANEKNGTNLQYLNFGYCRRGRDLQYVILKEILKKKKIKSIIIEVEGSENSRGHAIFPFITDGKELIFNNPFINENYFYNIVEYLTYHIELIQDGIYNLEPDAPIRKLDYGGSANVDTAGVDYLATFEKKRSIPDPILTQKKINRKFAFSFNYLRKIKQLCQEHDIKVKYLYLPPYKGKHDELLNYQDRSIFNEIIVPPKSILNNTDYWKDEEHLNIAGSAAFSRWLGEKM